MHEVAVSVPLVQHFKLSEKQKPKTDREIKGMSAVPCANVIGSVMYTMVCTRPYFAHPISIASKYMGNPERYHWKALKYIKVSQKQLKDGNLVPEKR